MDDALLNCVLGVCCPLAAQVERLTQAMAEHGAFAGHDDAIADAKGHEDVALLRKDREAAARAAATWILHHFDLAPKGTLKPLYAEIARVAKA